MNLDDYQMAALAGFDGNIFKKAVSSVRKTVSSFDPTKKGGIMNTVRGVGNLIAAPLVLPTAALVKGSTHLLAKTGVKPLVKLNSAATGVWNSGASQALRDSYTTQLIVGGIVGGAILAAPAVGAAASAVSTATGVTASSLTGAATTAAIAAAKAKAQALASQAAQSALTTATNAAVPPAQDFTPQTQAALEAQGLLPPGSTDGTARGSSNAMALGLGAAGLAVGGPVGGVIGLVAGFALGKKAPTGVSP